MIYLGIGLVAVGLVTLAYWQLILAEGTYLGPRVVAWTYDLMSRRYDAMKQFVPGDESWFVARPLLRGLQGVERPLLLDVATGTGRLPSALLHNRFRGQIVGLDLSRGMLRQAWAKLRTYRAQVNLIWQDASLLPFADATFDAVTCLESLEFMPHPLGVLSEMVRVLAPGGLLFVTNRVGYEARLLPGRAMPRPAFRQALAALPLHDVEVRPWQVQYDLALARKSGQGATLGRDVVPGSIEAPESASGRDIVIGSNEAHEVLTWLVRCPVCSGQLLGGVGSLSCPECRRVYPIREGIVQLAVARDQGKS
jgi:ubiquinone/menaquinone biosynthesis C-methylase UbiE